jgi:hypothetical protein
MIPYFIQRVYPSTDIRDDNVGVIYDCSEKNKLNENIINTINNIIYEFCSEEYGHGIKITSYNDFCNQYWEIIGFRIKGWDNIFRVYYFETTWIEWNIEDYLDQIYISYVKKCKNV